MLPQYDLNAWLETTVDISKYIDKYMEKDVQFSFWDNNFYKVESDILGTSIYYKQNQRDDYSSVS